MRSLAAEDAGLATRFAQGDPDAIRRIYQSHGGLVYSVAFKVLGNAALAEDATQQTFVQAWRAAATYDPTRSIDAWLASIARRAAIDVYRREARHRAETIDDAGRAWVTAAPSVEQLSDVWDVRKALEKLSDQDRQLVRLQHYDELTHAEIASELDIPLGTVKSRSFRAHRRLAGLLAHLRTSPDTDEHEKGRSHAR